VQRNVNILALSEHLGHQHFMVLLEQQSENFSKNKVKIRKPTDLEQQSEIFISL